MSVTRSVARLAGFGYKVGAAAPRRPPLLTDDQAYQESKPEINVSSTQFLNHFERQIEASLPDANYGLGDRTQHKYEVPCPFDNDEGSPYRGAFHSPV